MRMVLVLVFRLRIFYTNHHDIYDSYVCSSEGHVYLLELINEYSEIGVVVVEGSTHAAERTCSAARASTRITSL